MRLTKKTKLRIRLFLAVPILLLVTVLFQLFPSSSSDQPPLFHGQPPALKNFNNQLKGLSKTRIKIVKLVESQIGYRTNPVKSYCNKFSAYWFSGVSDCPNGELDEQWCADFAAWAWRLAGVSFTYQYINGDINSSSASFYEWGVRFRRWHAKGTGYKPLPGDVAVYGLDRATLIAAHVAVVIGTSGPKYAPAAVNGDADLKSFSDVEFVTHEIHPDAKYPGVALSGYVSP
ncbi:MAG TPA: CHAP domain-containing protein [Acidimicrobiales bacterium]|nr:CHAP domain-containing protein [Acidimicrobiales bacterium]